VNKVLLVGQGRWVRVLCEGLNELAADFSCRSWALDRPRQALSIASLGAALSSDIIVRVGFRPGAHTRYGVGFDLMWRALLWLNRDARAFVYWIGTDVQDVLRDKQSGRSMSRLLRLLRRAKSLAGSERLASELAEIGVYATLAPFPGGLVPAPEKVEPLPEHFTVLSYIPDARPEFYGGPQVLAAARALPGARFLIAGGSGGWTQDAPKNMEFLGWTDEMARILGEATVVVRLVEHDSVGGTAIEALLNARHLVYSYPLPYAEHVGFTDSKTLITVLSDLETAHVTGSLQLNAAGREWALIEFDRDRRFKVLARVLGEEDSP